MESPEIIEVEPNTNTIACDGGGGVMGHPVVYLIFEDREYIDCYYCGRRFLRLAQVAPRSRD